MKIIETEIEGLKLIDYSDQPTDSFDFFDSNYFSSFLPEVSFVQDNMSCSKKNVLRGLHVAIKKPQGKLLRVVKGSIFDVVIDLRKNSKTYGKKFTITLSENDRVSLYIPEMFAHGFLSLKDDTIVSFKVTEYWIAGNEVGICWNDPALNIPWPISDDKQLILSEKDSHYKTLKEAIQ